MLGAVAGADAQAPVRTAEQSVASIAAEIRKADYRGDQAEMARLYTKLDPWVDVAPIASRVRYWRGFAQWRRAINGFNDAVDPMEIDADLNLAIDEFERALAADPGFTEARIALTSSLGYLAYINPNKPERLQELSKRLMPVARQSAAEAPDNPRLLWVRGPQYWSTPPERGGGQNKAIDSYLRGLEVLKSSEGAAVDPLEPSWGKPELLMSLAWSRLNQTKPDPEAAQRYAQQALELVPYWHYVRDILMPQIKAAQAARAIEESPEQRKTVARRVFEEIFNQGKFEVATEIYAQDFVNHGLMRDAGLKEDQEAARGWRTAVPDLRMKVDMILADGEFVVILWMAEGTNTGSGNGLPATGKKLRSRGVTIFRIAGGKIREEWSEFDEAHIMQQLGLLVPASK
jgi:steroid delta-isomerase-like uncharacterized protein